jgi:1-pyrroline-5-carboxylate dehydrogenase
MAEQRSGGTGKITYATLAAGDMEEFHRQFDAGVERVREQLGRHYPNVIDGELVTSPDGEFADTNPSDTRMVLGYFQRGTREDARRAIEAAKRAFPGWSGAPWQERVAVMRRLVDAIQERKFEIAALLSMEVGKSRLEAIGDVEEASDLISYYCDQVERNNGFQVRMGSYTDKDINVSVLRPYGVFAVISPFNFPAALSAGPAGAALVAGNTVVFKPSSDTPWTGYMLYECTVAAGLPKGVFNYVAGPGSTVGEELVENPDVGGMVFTGSYEVGFNIYKRFSQVYARPCITEMGGKNPAIIMPSADLDLATDGVWRAAFGLSGQKCSACSRVYVHKAVKEPFVEMLVEKTRRLKIGDPLDRAVFMGPLINKRAHDNYKRYVELARRDGRVLFGGGIPSGPQFEHGWFVEPTIVDGLPKDHQLFKEELFVPIVCIAAVDSLDEALTLANDSIYGLTAGLYSRDQDEIQEFFNRIEAGVVYVNRRAGATTGAWPGIQPFGGWKASASTSRGSGGLYYVQQFMREQSRTVIEE